MNYGYKILNTWACHLTLREKKKIQWNWREFYICRCWLECSSGHWKNLTVPAEIAEGLFFLSGSTAGFVSTFHLWQSGLKLWMSSYCLPVKQTLEMSLACAYLYSSVLPRDCLGCVGQEIHRNAEWGISESSCITLYHLLLWMHAQTWKIKAGH